MRITDNPALTSSTLSGTDVMLLTDVDDLTNGKPKDKKLTFQNLASWVIQKASISFNAYTGGSRTLEDLVSTKPINQDTIDLNNYTVPGRYAMVAGDNRTYVNYPNNAVNGWLDVYKYAGTIKQYFHRLGSAPTTFKDEYFRMYIPGSTTWTDWEKIITATSLNSVLNANTVVEISCTGKTSANTNEILGNTGALAAGTYIITAGGCWASNQTGSRSIHLTTSSDGTKAIPAAHVTSGPANGVLWMQLVYPVTLTSSTTFYFAAWCNVADGVAFTAPYLRYVKLHD